MSDVTKPIKSGLGGWLIFVGLLLLSTLLSPLFVLSDWDLVIAYRDSLGESQSQAFSFQILLFSAQWVFNLYLIKLFFSKSAKFPFFFIALNTLTLVPAMVSLLTQVPSPLSIGVVSLPPDLGTLTFPLILAMLTPPLLYLALTTLYILYSKRVKNTFIH